MNIVSLNIIGCVISSKWRRLAQILAKGKAYMAFIQETKTQHMYDNFVSLLWGNGDVEWSAKDSKSASGR